MSELYKLERRACHGVCDVVNSSGFKVRKSECLSSGGVSVVIRYFRDGVTDVVCPHLADDEVTCLGGKDLEAYENRFSNSIKQYSSFELVKCQYVKGRK